MGVNEECIQYVQEDNERFSLGAKCDECATSPFSSGNYGLKHYSALRRTAIAAAMPQTSTKSVGIPITAASNCLSSQMSQMGVIIAKAVITATPLPY